MPSVTSAPLRQHYNAARLRSHTWEQLKLAVTDLDAGQGSVEEVKGILDDLHAIELYWAYPGRDTVRHLRDLLRSEEHHGLHLAVNHVVRMLSSGAFRSDPAAIADPESGARELLAQEAAGTGCIPDAQKAASYIPAYGMIVLTLTLLLRPTGMFGRRFASGAHGQF